MCIRDRTIAQRDLHRQNLPMRLGQIPQNIQTTFLVTRGIGGIGPPDFGDVELRAVRRHFGKGGGGKIILVQPLQKPRRQKDRFNIIRPQIDRSATVQQSNCLLYTSAHRAQHLWQAIRAADQGQPPARRKPCLLYTSRCV